LSPLSLLSSTQLASPFPPPLPSRSTPSSQHASRCRFNSVTRAIPLLLPSTFSLLIHINNNDNNTLPTRPTTTHRPTLILTIPTTITILTSLTLSPPLTTPTNRSISTTITLPRRTLSRLPFNDLSLLAPPASPRLLLLPRRTTTRLSISC
ncbi:hypothetical protein BDY24DRAFT_442571, partial [Mrakia frigida]|uniref:uncharacterized protein n=1 Tax=Mrakia frigida TaxID=29902 RepID=UPI003FCC018F